METYNVSQQTYVNGKVIKDEVIKAKYDGENLGLDIYDNGKHFYSKLNNNDIANILSHRASSIPLEKRLMKDFSIKNAKSYKKGKSNKGTNKTHKRKHKRKTYKKK